MPITPTDAVSRNLKWDDFQKKEDTPPAPGQAKTGAKTWTNVKSTPPQVVAADGGGFKLKEEPTVTIDFDKTSWVASFVLDWPKNLQDDLLSHEQIHYLISALSARDCYNAQMVVLAKTYPTQVACQTEIQAAQALILNKKIQEKYDDDTKHQPTQNSVIQAKWTTCVIGCRTSGAPLRPALKALGLFSD